MLTFEWDIAKNHRNLLVHGVAFGEAASVLQDPLGITTYDPDHSQDEDRHITVGTSVAGRLLLVGHTERGDAIRIITARKLTRNERRAYENELERRRG